NSDEVVLGNVAMVEQGSDPSLENKLIISLVNIEEERSLKNARVVRPTGLAGGLSYENPPVSLNLYLLFSANFANNYEKSLAYLSMVIEFFQQKQTFSLANSPNPGTDLYDFENNDLRVTFNIYTMTFEQLNHLWGALGGKQLPSALYRVYLVQLKDEQVREGGRLIEQIEGQENIF
ncbi:MAG: DUF4255 domain-containing protein, partial [Bacteroidota bacterium]